MMPSCQNAALAAALLSLLAAAPAAGQSRPPATAADGRVATEIERRLSADREVNAQNVTIYVRNGVVTLTGRVPEDAARREAKRVAGNVPGVSHVQNDISVGFGRGAEHDVNLIPEKMPGAD
jgi:osmotically-inducible protein OsmY